MSLLSSLISISKPMKGSSKSNVSSNGSSNLLMGSNSVACGSCGGGNSPSGYTNIDSNAGTYSTVSGYTYSYSYSYGYYSSGSCGCN